MSVFEQQAQRDAEARENERELADLRQARGNDKGGFDGIAEPHHERQRGQGLAEDDGSDSREHMQGSLDDDARIEQHSDRDEEQDRERILQRQCLFGGPLAELGLAQDQPCEEGAKGK